MKKFTTSSILALLLAVMSACAPANQNSTASDASDNHVIGGSTVTAGSAVSKQVFMLLALSAEGQSICTATLITRQHALTAAHCAQGVKKMFAVFAVDAMAKLQKGNPSADPDIVVVSSGRIHESWAGSSAQGRVRGVDAGDIAVVKLAKPAPAHMVVTKLATSLLTRGQTVLAAGYGITNGKTHDGSGLLRETQLSVEEPLVGKSEFYVDQSKGRGICSGDSGGPSFTKNSSGELVQVGITSRSDEFCVLGAIYTLVPAYSAWIDSAVAAL